MLKINDYVKIKDKDFYGKVTKVYKDKVSISYNNKNIVTNLDNVQKINEKDIPKYVNDTKVNVNYTRKFSLPSSEMPELMLRHKTLDQALYELDNFISDCIAQGIYTVKIVHGKNGGILRNATHEYLKSNKNIESYRLGGYYEGQYGVTIVNIKH